MTPRTPIRLRAAVTLGGRVLELDSRIDVTHFVGVTLGEEPGPIRAYPLARDFYLSAPASLRTTDAILLDADVEEEWPPGTLVRGV